MSQAGYFNRDLSWLSFNERVLSEAGSPDVPLFERVRFLGIYSSNLDEFYRVRMPFLQKRAKSGDDTYEQAVRIIDEQQGRFGQILTGQLIPELEKQNLDFCYQEPIPKSIEPFVVNYFYTQLAGLLHIVELSSDTTFFPESNSLYVVAITQSHGQEPKNYLINVPGEEVGRFVKTTVADKSIILFLEDIIRFNAQILFPDADSIKLFTIKVTRDAALEVEDAEDGVFEEVLEKQLKVRDHGLASRLLFEPGLSEEDLKKIVGLLKLDNASLVVGGRYHNLKDLSSLPVNTAGMTYPVWPSITTIAGFDTNSTLFEAVTKRDLMVHTPYQSYDLILRFFNEATIDKNVEEIYTTLYRVASDSKIVKALINAAKAGKKVTVLIELKARFDELNNLNWAKKMKAAGVKISYTVKNIKVHAKVVLVKRRDNNFPFLGLFATGNLNESTARFYTDHILFTAFQPMLEETEKLFKFLQKKKLPATSDQLDFRHLLVAQFNLQTRFIALIDREIANAKNGLSSGITIKLNNLEEEVLINKLYEASQAGVKIRLIVRSICRIIPGVKGVSENITVKRIVDRYLEHGRVFVFQNNDEPELFMGSADWMNRNIYRRIEVCVPVYNAELKKQLTEMIEIQWSDTEKAVVINENLENVTQKTNSKPVRSQEAIYQLLGRWK